MLEIWGDNLVQGRLENVTEDDESATPERLRGRIVLMAEYYPTGVVGTGEVDNELGSEEEKEQEQWEMERDREKDSESELPPNYKPAHICEELAALGYYARSMKPPKGWLSECESFPIFGPLY